MGRRGRTEPWSGQWVARSLGLALHDETPPGAGPVVRDLVGLALRRNPHRAHLPVSLVLGKHVPCDPGAVLAVGAHLGGLVRHVLAGKVGCVVLGYAENATGLGHLVADALDADHTVHTTRRTVPGATTLGVVDEQHSHARTHRLVPDDPGAWTPDLALVLVNDELTTGRTVAATMRMLHAARPRSRYVVAALVDLRGPGDDAVEKTAAELGVRLDVVATARGRLDLPVDVLDRGARIAASRPDPAGRRVGGRRDGAPGETVHLSLGGASEGARHGMDRADRAALDAALPDAATTLAETLGPSPGRVLVLGSEELLYLPLRLAAALGEAGYDVECSSTSRSPVVVVDAPGYPVRTGLAFPAHDASADPGERFAYNLGRAAAPRYDVVVLVVDRDARTPALRVPGGLLDQLRGVVPRVVEAVVPGRPPRGAGRVPARRGPAFGTFAPEEVGWLLDDLSAVALETPTAEREDAVRGGRRHYSETLPEEHAPGAAYEALFRRALDRSAARVAAAVGAVTDRVLATRGPAPVLVSLARAGTPVGVLMRRWASRVRGVELAHYTMSVIRDRGLDRAALAALTAVHDPAALVLVDAWTGKGSILDEVAADLAAHRRATGLAIDPTVVVLADPAHAAAVHGTREDVLVPSACLNATVSGLVSRTVRRADLVAPGGHDGAKFYPGLAGADRTAEFLDAVAAHFPGPDAPVAPVPDAGIPDRRGPRYVTALARDLGVDDERRIKAGVGETTRALLRRAPSAVLLDPDAGPDADHLRHLARERDVPVLDLPASAGGVPGPYRAVGLIGP